MLQVNILLLGGESSFANKVARALGCVPRWRIHVLARAAGYRRHALFWSRHVASFHTAKPTGDEQDYLAAIRRVVAKTGAAIIMPVDEASSLFCIRHREALATMASLTPLPSADSFATAIDKGLLADFLARHGIPHPPTCLPRHAIDSGPLTYPVLVKPRRASGGGGFTLVRTQADLPQDLARRGEPLNVCVQEYVEGIDMGCSVLAGNGRILAWTTQRGLQRPRPYGPYSVIQMETSASVHQITAQLMQALNWSGVANVDFRIEAGTGRALVLEVNGRFWDSLWASSAAGVNFPDLLCRLTLGEALPPNLPQPGLFVQPRALPQDILHLRPRVFRFRWNGLSMILTDPLPEAITGLRSLRAKIR